MTIRSRDTQVVSLALAKRDLAEYGIARLRDQVFDAVLGLWHRRKAEGWTQKRVAETIGRDPGWVSRNLHAPGNWTLRTAGELIQGLDGEAEVSVVALEDASEALTNFDAYEGYIPAGDLRESPNFVSFIVVDNPIAANIAINRGGGGRVDSERLAVVGISVGAEP